MEKFRLCLMLSLFTIAIMSLITLYLTMPQIEEMDKINLHLPRNLKDAQLLGNVLKKYNRHNQLIVGVLYFLVYIFLQTFAIPGSIFLSILSGFLYPYSVAVVLVGLCSAIGATNCYLISKFLGRAILKRWMPSQLQKIEDIVKKQENFLFLTIFLRITPLVPNWAINILAPLVDWPIQHFFFGTFIGVCIPSLFYVRIGTTLLNLTNFDNQILPYSTLFQLILISIIPLAPIILKDSFSSCIFSPTTTSKQREKIE
ncbi:hypothetical protein SNEBB_009940 [Seison nebaliae]|nr:hypothetical protein SNEBB_009940 [Seison nebaliae]